MMAREDSLREIARQCCLLAFDPVNSVAAIFSSFGEDGDRD
jgi:hypothetical protein